LVSASQAVALGTPDSRRVATRAAKGAVALGGRQFVVQGLNVTGSIALARLLSPADFGIYAITIFLIQFLGSFGGTGLACSLIRVPAEPSEDEYSAVFTFQQIGLAFLVLGLWIVSPYIVGMYELNARYVWLFRMTAVALFITSFMVIPQVRLEREMGFAKLAIVEIWQAIVFNTSAVTLAWMGWGGMSFAVALVARSSTGVLALYASEPWRPHWRIDWEHAKPHLSFGFYYQSSQVISLIKDAVSPVLIGALAGTAAVGYISWANMLASYPVLILMALHRIYVPAFSRLQHDRAQLAMFVERVLLATNSIVSPIAIFTLVLIHPITILIFGSKWASALPMYFLFWSANLFVPASIPILGLLNALGRSRLCFGFTALWAALTWALGVPLVLWIGPVGLAWASLGVQLSNVALFMVAQKEIRFRMVRPTLFPWMLAVFIGGGIFAFEKMHPVNSVILLIVCFACGICAYAAVMGRKFGRQVRSILASQA
jgi:O-antigen/teichoic acid export membrane protein